MTDFTTFGHKRWATELSQLLRAVLGEERFPVDVEKLAMEISGTRFPNDPLIAIKGDSLPGFEGALYPVGNPREGWAVIYNNENVSPGRVRFTIGHEFGHYLAHRQLLPDGIKCDDKVVIQRAGIGIEKEADEFAAYLLMPFDDFRRRLAASDKPGIVEISACAERYGVSLIAATLRWLEYTDRRAVFVVSTEGGALWSKSSDSAFKSGRFIRTAKQTFMLPEASFAARGVFDSSGRASGTHPPGVWFPEETEELSVRSNRYELTLTLLHLPKEFRYLPDVEPRSMDTFEKFFERG
jgi:IrrE N-terminal-like domain